MKLWNVRLPLLAIQILFMACGANTVDVKDKVIPKNKADTQLAVTPVNTPVNTPTYIPTNTATPISENSPINEPNITPSASAVPIAESATLMVASDIQEGDWSNAAKFEKTAQIIEKENPDAVIIAGDASNSSGTAANYQQFDKAWGRFKNKIFAVPGNHDYITNSANPFFDYFNGTGSTKGVPDTGTHAGSRGKGYFAVDVGSWTVIGLNWYADSSHTYKDTDAQMQWLKETMQNKPAGRPVLFYSHSPRYTKATGHSENQGSVSVAWNIMLKYQPDVKIFVGGHLNGIYERWKPMDNNKKHDSVNGIRSFLVATGGASPYSAGTVDTLLESTAKVYGAMKLVLRSNGYDWEFKPITGSTFSDKGSFDF